MLSNEDHASYAAHYQRQAAFHAARAMADRARGFFNVEPAMSAEYFAGKARFHLFRAIDIKAGA